MKNSPKVSCVVLTLNDKANVLDCLASLSHVHYPNLEIVVSDNGSTDGTVEVIRNEFSNVTLIENEHNLRFSGGNNVGIEYAMKEGADYVLLLNNDTVVEPHFISEMVKVAESDPKIGLLGPKIYYHGEPQQLWYAGGKVHLWRGIVKHIGIREMDIGQYEDICDVDYVTGCALMMKRLVVEKIGMLDPSYVAYSEDTDFALRAKKVGFRLVYVPKAIIWHKIGGFWGVVTRRKIWQKLRSHFILFRRYSQPLAWFTTIPLFFIWDTVRVLTLILAGKIRQ